MLILLVAVIAIAGLAYFYHTKSAHEEHEPAYVEASASAQQISEAPNATAIERADKQATSISMKEASDNAITAALATFSDIQRGEAAELTASTAKPPAVAFNSTSERKSKKSKDKSKHKEKSKHKSDKRKDGKKSKRHGSDASDHSGLRDEMERPKSASAMSI
ncbi:hypothetical protein AAVH_05635 [Aphelenchoides avenae]|nr:hypothetical protein AAVH_05635 [Aphelenchus avenae]